jgi:hypothetical protein
MNEELTSLNKEELKKDPLKNENYQKKQMISLIDNSHIS